MARARREITVTAEPSAVVRQTVEDARFAEEFAAALEMLRATGYGAGGSPAPDNLPIVQALLITRHMLFVGFSLTDDNFQRVVDDVRKALQGTDGATPGGGQFGTALSLRHDPLLEELWQDSVRLAAMADSGAGTSKDAAQDAARRLDIFLDLLLAAASRGAIPLLDHAFDGILTAEEWELRELLQILACKVSPELRDTPAWQPLARLLGDLGAKQGHKVAHPSHKPDDLAIVSRLHADRCGQ